MAYIIQKFNVKFLMKCIKYEKHGISLLPPCLNGSGFCCCLFVLVFKILLGRIFPVWTLVVSTIGVQPYMRCGDQQEWSADSF